MDNRFGIKDFFLFLLVCVLIVIVLLAMKQYDRQWDELRSIRSRLEGQARDLRDIQDALARGVVADNRNGGGGATTLPADARDPFFRIRAAQLKPGYARGDWLVDLFPGQVAKLTPLLSGDAYASEVQDQVLESLATRDPDTLEWRPMLAEDWQITDTSDERKAYIDQRIAAGKTTEEIAKDPAVPPAVKIRFKLRDNLRFSDGHPLTAQDVVFTYNLIMNPAIAAPRQKAYLERIRQVTATGTSEVEFVFAEPYFEAFELAAGFQVMPKHFYETFPAETFNQSVGLLLGSGPYRLESPTSWKPGTAITLVRNERYWGLQPAFNRLVFKEISSDKGRLAAFRNGEVDVFGATPEQYYDMIKDAELLKRVHNFEYQSPVGGYRYIAWNQKNPLFADKRVRRALTLLLDRQRMIDQIMLGYGVIATGPFNPQSKQYNPQVKPYPFDVEGARKALAEAGFQDRNGDGVIESPDGKPFEFRLTYPAGSGNYDKMALFAKDAYARAGIVLKPDPLEWAVFTERIEQKNFEAISLGWTSGIETDIYQMFHSSQSGPGGDNFISYKSPELDAAIDQARQEMDEARRMPLWQKAHEIIHEDQPYTFLWFGKSLVFIDNRIDNVLRVKLGLNPLTEWFVPADRQKYTQQ